MDQARQMTDTMAKYRTGDTAAAASAVKQAAFPGPERRGPNRPFAKKPAARAAAPAPAARPKAQAAAGGEHEWSEF
jgi:hypothetical protein